MIIVVSYLIILFIQVVSVAVLKLLEKVRVNNNHFTMLLVPVTLGAAALVVLAGYFLLDILPVAKLLAATIASIAVIVLISATSPSWLVQPYLALLFASLTAVFLGYRTNVTQSNMHTPIVTELGFFVDICVLWFVSMVVCCLIFRIRVFVSWLNVFSAIGILFVSIFQSFAFEISVAYAVFWAGVSLLFLYLRNDQQVVSREEQVVLGFGYALLITTVDSRPLLFGAIEGLVVATLALFLLSTLRVFRTNLEK